jgi:acetyl-CoA carboxylase carboxyl transferase subunit alpha
MGVTAERLKSLELIDSVLEEPLGGAHRDPDAMAETIRRALVDSVTRLEQMSADDLLDARYKRLMSFGSYKD